MCGIAGLWRTGSGKPEDLEPHLRRMADALRHRGPDDQGHWTDATLSLGFAHRRLSVVDLSPEGRQPMVSPSGRFVLCFNGEIYNHRAVRKELEKAGRVQWRGHSDTEVMLAAFEHYGFSGALEKFEGMFAFALWDREKRILRLTVDRLGEKPLYYAWNSGTLAFASELKGLRTLPDFQFRIHLPSVHQYLRYGYIPAPLAVYEGVHKLEPGHVLTVDTAAMSRGAGEPEPYWSVAQAWNAARLHPFAGSETEAEEELDRRLRAVISDQMAADVPVGVFLSGGVDSTAVSAVMQALSPGKARTFNIGFGLKDYDESGHARRVAEHLGTDHTELIVSPEEALTAIPGLPEIYDEPFADSSQIPTWLVSRLARRHVTVSLSGDGGDEVFGGYNRYIWGVELEKILRFPRIFRLGLGKAIRGISPALLDKLWIPGQKIFPGRFRVGNPGQKLHKLAENLMAENGEELYEGLVSCWRYPGTLIQGWEGEAPRESRVKAPGASTAEWMMLQDMAQYLPGDILVKVDRAAMHNSLETRTPFLNHALIEWAMTLPLNLKVRKNRGKILLRRWLRRYVPDSLMERPKTGFSVPLHAWLRGPLRGWAEGLLAPSRLEQGGIFRAAPVRAAWEEHLRGGSDRHHLIWAVLMFEAWRSHK